MILSLVVIALVGMIAYVWASRGFFSSMIHMLCVLVAGAVAFGVWEPLGYAILSRDPPGWIVDLTWGASLALPFAIVLAVLRLGIDSLLPANAELDGATNLAGGAACGLISGTISVGILILALSFLRLPASFMGHQAMGFESNGSVKRESSLLFPADKITAGLYSYMSKTTLRTRTPMAQWRPRLADEGHLLRTNFNEGGAKHTLTPKAFEILGRYTVGLETTVPVKQLTSDSFPPDRPHNVVMMDGSPPANPYIEGIIMQFKPGAREKEGRVVIGNAQIRMVCVPTNDPENGDPIAVHPFSMISQGQGDSVALGRWRFDKPKIYIASVGGAAESTMAFEFLVPKGFQPLALYVKGIRVDARNMPQLQKFADTQARDGSIRAGTLLSSALVAGGELDLSNVIKIDPRNPGPNGLMAEIVAGGGIAGNHLLDKGNLGAVQIDDTNKIIQSDVKYRLSDLKDNRILNRSLQVREFAATEDTRVVQLRVGMDSRVGLLSSAALNADLSKAPVLIDDRGQRYVAIGYVYQDASELHIKLTPGSPIRNVNDLPNGGPTSSRPDQKFSLVYRVSQGVNVKYFAIGDTVIGEFDPPVNIVKFD